MKITKLLRFLLIATAMVMVFSLFACTETPEEVTTEGTEESVESSEDKGNTPDDPEPPTDTDPAEGSSAEETDPEEENSSESEKITETETETETEAKPECQHEAVVDAAVAPTCEDTGLTEGSHCGLCNEVIVAQEPVAALGHAWNDGEITTAPTCEGEGVKTFTCANDDTHTKTEPVAALGHAWNDGEITTAPTCVGEGVKTFTCANDDTHTKTEPVAALGHAPGEPDKANGCDVKCTTCNETLEEGKHAEDKIAAVWTPLAEKTADGKLQEGRICSDCSTYAFVRETAYKNNADGVKVNGIIINPTPYGQTVGCEGSESKQVVLDGATSIVDGNGDPIVVTDSLSIFGWFACNGGVERYVYQVNGGAWMNAVGTTSDITADGNPAHVSAILKAFPDFTDYMTNVLFSNGLRVANLQQYANQTITVTFAAVPANNPGTADEPNVLPIITIENVFVTCKHVSKDTVWTLDANDPQYEVSEKCAACDAENLRRTATVTAEGLLCFTPDQFKEVAGNAAEVIVEENGMSYVRFTAKKTTSEETVHLISGTDVYTNIGGYIAILYRSSISQRMEVVCEGEREFVHQGVRQFGIFDSSDAWNFEIVETGSHSTFDGKSLTAFRFDYFNAERTTLDTTDIAFCAFFSSREAAFEYYRSYVQAYLGEDKCEHQSDNKWVLVEGEAGKIETHCIFCDCSLNKKECDHPDSEKLSDIEPVEGKPLTYSAYCSICGGRGELVGLNNEGLLVLTPDELMLLGPGSTYTQHLMNDENANSMPFYRALAAKAGEGTLTINNGNIALDGVARYVGILYRTNKNNGLQLYMNPFGVTGTGISATRNTLGVGEWGFALLDLGDKFGDATSAGWTRLDVLNGTTPAIGDYMDIGFISFFTSRENAEEYYKQYIKAYDIKNSCEFKVNFDQGFITVDGSSTCVSSAVATNFAPNRIDYADKTLTGVNTLTVGGWCVTPGGVDYYGFRVVTSDGNKSGITKINDGGDQGADAPITKQGTGVGYTASCGIGAGFQSKNRVNLTGYEGQTVTVEIVAVSNFGQEIVIAVLTNVTVPGSAS